jgi:hypothetical protein
MLLTTKLTVVSQAISTDSLKCFTYEEARQIITDLQQLPIKDSIIDRYDSIVRISDTIIKRHEILINNQYKTIKSKSLKIDSLKKNRKYLIIFGSIIGLLTQLLF